MREAASADLEEIGEPAREALRKAAASSDDVEIRKRAEDVLRTIIGRTLEREQKQLDGTWSLVSYEVDGKQIKGEDKAHVFGFKRGRWSMTVGGAQFQGGTITSIEPAGKHNTIDLLISEGGNPGATAYSIFAIDGDTLRYLNCGLPRSSEFVTKPGDGRHYLTFRRVKGGEMVERVRPNPVRVIGGVGVPPGGP
jgi:uncharacterized protein (TIGR03067 family)